MSATKPVALTPVSSARDPLAMLRHQLSELDRMFGDVAWPSFGLPSLFLRTFDTPVSWAPRLDVVEKDNHLVAKMDLPGMKREDVNIQVADGCLAISGERKHEAEAKEEHGYRYEREYGTFYRAIPLPDGVNVDGIKATFVEGVLEVSMPLPAKPASKARRVEIEPPAIPPKAIA